MSQYANQMVAGLGSVSSRGDSQAVLRIFRPNPGVIVIGGGYGLA